MVKFDQERLRAAEGKQHEAAMENARREGGQTGKLVGSDRDKDVGKDQTHLTKDKPGILPMVRKKFGELLNP